MSERGFLTTHKEHNKLMHALWGNGIEKLQLTGIPTLRKGEVSCPTWIEFSLDFASFCEILNITTSALYFDPAGLHPEPSAADKALGVRYLCAAIEDKDLQSVVAQKSRGWGATGFEWLEGQYLQGTAKQPALQQLVDGMALQAGQGIIPFKARFEKFADALEPRPSQHTMSTKFTRAITRNFGHQFDECVASASASADKNNFAAPKLV